MTFYQVNGKKLMDYQREGLEVPKVYSDIEIYYELIPKGEWLDSFVHYDSELLKKYPQYKNF